LVIIRLLKRQLSFPVSTMSAVVGYPVEQRGGHLGIAEDTGSLAERQVDGHDSRGAFVELADEAWANGR
jgi:hypothetical protein